MADAKYGVLFTLDDVKLIAGYRPTPYDDEGWGRFLAELEERGELAFPADEPLFLLRGQDSAAVEPLMRYVHLAEAYGATDEWGDRARAAIDRMYEWQQAHPDRVKVPD